MTTEVAHAMARGMTLRISVDSELAGQPARRLLDRMSSVPLRDVGTVELCLHRAETVDVEMISAIVRLHGGLAATGRRLVLVNATELVHDLLDRVGLTHSIAVSRRREELVPQESGLHPLL